MSKSDPFSLCGTTIDGKYRVLSVVGEGGFGVVYRGLHAGFDVPIAVKCLKLPPHLDRRAQEQLVDTLREEGRLLLQLSQRTAGIVQALDVGSFTTPGGARVPYLILEWLDGRTLSEELRLRRTRAEGGMTLREALALLEPAARALAVAHAEKIAHRDVKPENLFLVDAPGKQGLKILDFGIAKVLADVPSAAEAVTSGGPTAFTPSYGAPEQFDKRRGASGPWTDVFALALVFVELVTGARALEGDDLMDFYRASADPDHRPTLRAKGAQAPDAVEQVLQRALHVEPRSRYAGAGAFWDALARAVEGGPAVEGSPQQSSVATAAERAEDAALSTVEFASSKGIALEGANTSGGDLGLRTTVRDGDRVRALPGGEARPQAGVTTKEGVVATKEGVATTKEGVVATERAAVRTAPRLPRNAVAAIAVLGGVGLVVAGVWRLRSPEANAPAQGNPAPSASAVLSPVSQDPKAAALYAEAIQAWRGGAPDDAVYSMEQAASIDRGLGAAQLRLALWKFNKKPVVAREHYDLALRHRGSLGAQDQRLLDAVQPLMRDPSDLIEYEKRLEALAQSLPGDVELWSYLGATRLKRLRFDAAIEAFDRVLATDPGTVAAWVLKAECLSMSGDHKGQLQAYDACLQNSPRAIECQLQKIALHGRLGDCTGMRDEARRLLSMNPNSALTQKQLAMSLQATGTPREGVVEALSKGWTFRPDSERQATELNDRSALAILEGDFPGAVAFIEQWQAAVSQKTDQDAHAFPAVALAAVYQEMGLPKKAGAIVDDFMRRMHAWTEPSLTGWTIALLPFAFRAGAISRQEFDRGRQEWAAKIRSRWNAAGRRLDTEFDWMIWSEVSGAWVETEPEAREALGTMPREIAPVMRTGRWMAVDLHMGKVHVLAGEPSRALVPLRRAAGSCSALADPIRWVDAQFYLGMALEATGDVDGARGAYETVLSHWGKAKPKSVTALKAKARLKALGAKGR